MLGFSLQKILNGSMTLSMVIMSIVMFWIFTEHVFVIGHSAGAHLLGIYSAICTNKNYASKFSFTPPKGFVPKAIALNCGVIEVKMKKDSNSMLKTLIKDFLVKDRFDEIGVKYKHVVYGDKTNLLNHVFHCDIRNEEAKKCNDNECEFF